VTQAEPYVRSPLKLSPGSLIMMMSTTSPMSRLMMCWPVLGYTGGGVPSSRNTVRGLLLFTLCKQHMPVGCRAQHDQWSVRVGCYCSYSASSARYANWMLSTASPLVYERAVLSCVGSAGQVHSCCSLHFIYCNVLRISLARADGVRTPADLHSDSEYV